LGKARRSAQVALGLIPARQLPVPQGRPSAGGVSQRTATGPRGVAAFCDPCQWMTSTPGSHRRRRSASSGAARSPKISRTTQSSTTHRPGMTTCSRSRKRNVNLGLKRDQPAGGRELGRLGGLLANLVSLSLVKRAHRGASQGGVSGGSGVGQSTTRPPIHTPSAAHPGPTGAQGVAAGVPRDRRVPTTVAGRCPRSMARSHHRTPPVLHDANLECGGPRRFGSSHHVHRPTPQCPALSPEPRTRNSAINKKEWSIRWGGKVTVKDGGPR